MARTGRLVRLEAHSRKGEPRKGKPVDGALDQIETLHSAVLRAIPDLMFVIHKNGTYLDYHASNPKMLFLPPSAFIGKTIRQVMPPSLADVFADAITSALGSRHPVKVEYELPLGSNRRLYEARLTSCGSDRVVAIVRDLTEIENAHAQSRNLAGRLIASQEMERMRIARELHDDLGQKVALLNIEIDRLVEIGNDRGDLADSHRRLSAQVAGLARDLNQIAHQLHPSKVHALRLDSSIRSVCTEFSKRHALNAIFVQGALPKSVDPNVSLCLYRITQEALHNVIRHSRAHHVSVKLASTRDSLSLRIVDDGVGFDAMSSQAEGLGLVSMRERVSLVGGTLHIWSKPERGTRIEAAVPLRQGARR
jgi:signal transduction histidine kinase